MDDDAAQRAKSAVVDPAATDLAPRPGGDLAQAEELPVVARLAIEIRSDGIRTVARGAMHDLASGQQVAIEVNAGSVLELGSQLAAAVGKSLFSLPRLIFGRQRQKKHQK